MTPYADLLGAPFKVGGRGPTEFDCYGLVREMYRRARGVVLPEYVTYETRGENHSLISAFRQTDWASVGMGADRAVVFQIGRYACHIGYMLNREQFIHTLESTGGPCVERLSLWSHRIAGFYDYVRG